MPKIDDASHLKFSGLVHQLALNRSSPDADKELRATGKTGQGLYIKTGQAVFTSAKNRAQHRADAMTRIRDSLVKEYRCLLQDAEQIMKNVLGEPPPQASMTVGNARKLYEIGTLAWKFMEKGTEPQAAFELARKLAHDRAGDLDSLTGTLKQRGLDDQEAFEAACVVRAQLVLDVPEKDAITGVVIAQKLAAGTMTPNEAKDALIDLAVGGSFLDAVKNTMRGLPPYERSTATEKTKWLNIANALGAPDFLPAHDLGCLNTGDKASLRQALSDRVDEQHRQNNGPGIDAAYRAVACFNRWVRLKEMMSSDEETKMATFLGICRTDPVVIDAKNRWSDMSSGEQENAINRIIDLHAKEFGYSVSPNYLKFYVAEGRIAGHLSINGDALYFNRKFHQGNGFPMTLETVCHESTHKCQLDLIEKLAKGALVPGSQEHDRARLMKASYENDINDDYLFNNRHWPEKEAYAAYRQSPVERHAFVMGQTASLRFR